jgi:hypothetical protein
MGTSASSRHQQDSLAFKKNVGVVLEARGMNANDLAKAVERKGGKVSKTVYNALNARHPPNIATMQDIASELDVPLWILLIPNLPAQILLEAERARFAKVVADFLGCDEIGRTRIAEAATSWGAICEAKKGK